MSSISTKRGDTGNTSLLFGGRVPKTHLRVRAYGTVDELAAHIGMARATAASDEAKQRLEAIQAALLKLGAELATSNENQERWLAKGGSQILRESDLDVVEAHEKDLEDRLPPFKKFSLPGSTLHGAHLHVCRTIARRAERRVLLARESGETIRPLALSYLNRLSDYFWLLAREEETGQG